MSCCSVDSEPAESLVSGIRHSIDSNSEEMLRKDLADGEIVLCLTSNGKLSTDLLQNSRRSDMCAGNLIIRLFPAALEALGFSELCLFVKSYKPFSFCFISII